MVSAILNPGQGENAKPEAAPTTLVGMLEYLKLFFFFNHIDFYKGKKKRIPKMYYTEYLDEKKTCDNFFSIYFLSIHWMRKVEAEVSA